MDERKNKEEKEVFCYDCKHYRAEIKSDDGMLLNKEHCTTPKNIYTKSTRSYLKLNVDYIYIKSPKKINMANNCRWFKTRYSNLP